MPKIILISILTVFPYKSQSSHKNVCFMLLNVKHTCHLVKLVLLLGKLIHYKMKLNYLFPHKYKRIGWIILIPAVLLGLFTLITNYEPYLLEFNVPAIFAEKLFGENEYFKMINNNILNEILGVLIIVSGLFVAFSKEKLEDELISKIRLESLVWAVFLNYAVLLLAIIFIYDMPFFWVMIFNMFTILIFFIIRFNWQIYRLKNAADYEE